MVTDYGNSSIDIKDKIVSEQSHSTNDVTCGGSLENPTHKLSKKIEKSIFPGLSLSNPTEEDRNFIFRDENDNVMVVDKTQAEKRYVWRKITSIDEYVSGEEYLIVFEDNNIGFNGSLLTLDVDNNVMSVEIVGSDIIYDERTKSCEFIISDIDGGVSVLSKIGYYIGRTSNSNGMNTSTETPYVNTIDFDENGNVIVTSSAGPKLQKNSGGDRFRYYKSTQRPIQLYKKTEISTPDVYTWKTLVSNDDIDVITEEELDEILIPQCIPGNKMDC